MSLIETIIIITLIIAGTVCFGWLGYKAGMDRKNGLVSFRTDPNVESNNDSVIQARMIGKSIAWRATLLNNPALSTRQKVAGRTFNFFAFDYTKELKTDNTMAFLKGNSINLIRFCRMCHSCGVSIRLRQIGLKYTEKEKKPGFRFVSRPEATLFLKNQ